MDFYCFGKYLLFVLFAIVDYCLYCFLYCFCIVVCIVVCKQYCFVFFHFKIIIIISVGVTRVPFPTSMWAPRPSLSSIAHLLPIALRGNRVIYFVPYCCCLSDTVILTLSLASCGLRNYVALRSSNLWWQNRGMCWCTIYFQSLYIFRKWMFPT